MPEIILHHFDASPFAEKVRLMLGLKQLAWCSVEIPMVMPKPELTALTGGYRKTPVMQLGADVYCDTRLIALELEARHPQPTLFGGGQPGVSLALSAWSDRAFFEPGAGLSMALNKSGLPEAIINDRKSFFNFMDFERLEQAIPHFSSQLRGQAQWVERQLADGRRFLFGDAADLADIHAYFVVWMTRANVPTAPKLFAGFDRLAAWEQRMQALGHGSVTAMTAMQALAVARTAAPLPGGGVEPDDPSGLRAGMQVSVAADDYGRDPVQGELITLDSREIAVLRSAPAAGHVAVHFPRIGYTVAASSSAAG